MKQIIQFLLLVFILGGLATNSYCDVNAENEIQKSVEKKSKKTSKNHKSKKSSKKQVSAFEIANSGFVIENKIDEIVLKNLCSKKIVPAFKASEAVMLRRVYLDLTGTIPNSKQADEYLTDKSKDKYERLVDALLASDDFNIYTTMRIGDFLRIKSEFPINLWPNAAQAYTRYVYSSVAQNKSWADMVYEMLTSSGSNFRVGQVNFYRAMQAKNPTNYASAVALSFMGLDFESLTKPHKNSLVNIFKSIKMKETKEWKEEIVFDDPLKTFSFIAKMPNGDKLIIENSSSPRVEFARWLTSKKNPYLAKVFVNRVWNWLIGTPIISPADNINGSNVNPELIEYLTNYFVENNFDIRKLFRLIVLSRTYAGSPIPRDDIEKSVENFASYKVRQAEAEVVNDLLCKVTEIGEVFESTTPEPYTLMPKDTRAIALYDAGITTSFLELFGKTPRDTGKAQERVNAPSASQRLHVLNSTHVRRKIERSPVLSRILNRKDFIRVVYLHLLSRYPTQSEVKFFKSVKTNKQYKNWQKHYDLMWALINSEEFINKH
ncbi:MAG: DUF1553 domain-containing protein [Verrucomicrobiaceae bacterium]|nr:DUF1553 domain-containing protein [Verrucomicrobiaceae bacterium]